MVDEFMRPTFSNLLSQRIDVIIDGKARNNFSDRSCDFFRSEGHRMKVIAGSHCQILWFGFHNLKSSIYSVISVDHGQRCIFFQVASEFLLHNSFVVDIYGIVCGSTSWCRTITHKPRVAETPYINAIAVKIIVAPQLAWFFSNPVNSFGLLNS